MRVVKVLIVALATLFGISTVEAATLVKPVEKAGAGSYVVLTKMMRKHHRHHRHHRHHHHKAGMPGKCGAFMFYKHGKCHDARKKK